MDPNTLRWIERLIREDKLVRFYQSGKWRAIRKRALERDHYECQRCAKHGRYRSAQNVHHLQEVKLRPDLALDINNVESLCIKCHNEVHDKRKRIDKRKPFVNIERW